MAGITAGLMGLFLVVFLVAFMFAPAIIGFSLATTVLDIHPGFIIGQIAWFVFWHFQFTGE